MKKENEEHGEKERVEEKRMRGKEGNRTGNTGMKNGGQRMKKEGGKEIHMANKRKRDKRRGKIW